MSDTGLCTTSHLQRVSPGDAFFSPQHQPNFLPHCSYIGHAVAAPDSSTWVQGEGTRRRQMLSLAPSKSCLAPTSPPLPFSLLLLSSLPPPPLSHHLLLICHLRHRPGPTSPSPHPLPPFFSSCLASSSSFFAPPRCAPASQVPQPLLLRDRRPLDRLRPLPVHSTSAPLPGDTRSQQIHIHAMQNADKRAAVAVGGEEHVGVVAGVLFWGALVGAMGAGDPSVLDMRRQDSR
eukprot:2738145-Rhodomonas_salina.1